MAQIDDIGEWLSPRCAAAPLTFEPPVTGTLKCDHLKQMLAAFVAEVAGCQRYRDGAEVRITMPSALDLTAGTVPDFDFEIR